MIPSCAGDPAFDDPEWVDSNSPAPELSDETPGQSLNGPQMSVQALQSLVSTQKLVDVDGLAGDQFGAPIALSGTTALIGSRGSDPTKSEQGSFYVYVRDGGSWVQQAQLMANDDARDFEYFPASLGLAGNTAIAGRPTDYSVGGSVHVFVRNGTAWAQQAKLVASDGTPSYSLGEEVAISGDTVAAAATLDAKGLVYVFVRNGGSWTQQAKVVPSHDVKYNEFGVALSILGNTLFVTGLNPSGQRVVYVFERNGSVWTEQAQITSNDVQPGDYFGDKLASSTDTLAVGAEGKDGDRGAVYVFTRNGTTWTQQQKLVASDRQPGHYFGGSVSLSGNRLLIGNYDDAAYLFEKVGGVWFEQQKLTSNDGQVNDGYGDYLGIDGNTVLIGASRHHIGNGADQGAAYVHELPALVQPCSSATDCASGFCVDGFCCDAVCDSPCMACNAAKKGAGTDGVCGLIAAGTDPDDDCPFGACGALGFCVHENGTSCENASVCLSGHCVDGVCCDNACNAGCMACSAAKKGSGADGVCGSIAYDTDPDNDCPTGACDGNNQCQAYNGVACTKPSQCLSGYCVDGFCCNNICMNECSACSAAKKGGGLDGQCGPIAANTDPDNECAGGDCNASGACSTLQTKSANGAACISAAQCESGYCADGVCCDSWCLGDCMACSSAKKGSGADGTCGAIAAETDPDTDCGGGVCDGLGVCKYYNGAPCAYAAACLSGYCVDGFCCGNICDGMCAACSATKKGYGPDGVCGPIAAGRDVENECVPGECNGSGKCNQPQTLRANGAACQYGLQCASGQCADGVCCNIECDGVCQACTAALKGSGIDGTCGPIPYDTDPEDECFGGACSGTGACKQYNGLSCDRSSECLSNFCVDGFCCNNICMNECSACSAAKKGGGLDGQCGPIAGNTDPDNECANGVCNVSGACSTAQPKFANGAACVSAAQCESGFCADGVCCDSWCLGTCMACTAAIKGSGADGVCGAIASETDPDVECGGGVCDGKGVCKYYNGAPCTNSAACLSGYCVDGYCCGGACDGYCAACSAVKKGYGYNGVCELVVAGNDLDNECDPGECNGAGSCNLPQVPRVNGAACVHSAQCASGYCVDGLCCNSACTGLCRSCSAAIKGQGSDGTCDTIAIDQDPEDECFGGACSGEWRCKFYNGVACAGSSDCLSNYCVDGFCCNNACTGLCQACSAAKKGSGYDGQCGPIAGNTDPDNECVNAECNGSGSCTAPQPKANGASCQSAAECVSGRCVEGVCCNTACTGTCYSCLRAYTGGVDGRCDGIRWGTDPYEECPNGACTDAWCAKYDGEPCSGWSGDCVSGYCVDGVCCNQECNGLCKACSTAKKGGGANGVCGSIGSGLDPDNECPTGVCSGGGICTP